MIGLLPRSTWTSHGPIKSLTRMDPQVVRGFAVHWPGSSGSWPTDPTVSETARILEQERVQHTSPSTSDPTKPWSDIAYQCACDQAGRIFDCRGIQWRSAANGSAATNAQWGALTVLMGENDTPTAAVVEAVRWWRQHVWLPEYPHATAVVGHRDLYQTDCPGSRIYQLVRDGVFTNSEGDMSLSQADLDAIRNVVQQEIDSHVPAAVWASGWPTAGGRTETAQDRLLAAARQTAVVPMLTQQEAHVDVQALADAVAARLPAGSDAQAVAAAVWGMLKSKI